MKWWLIALMIAAPGLAGAQPLLEFRNDLAFAPGTVESFAEKSYREKLHQLEQETKLDANPAFTARIRRLVARLNRGVARERPARSQIRWEVHTCLYCDEEASAMAGGKLLVGEDFIKKLAPTDDELAFLLAHEMAHVLAEHTREFATAARYFVDNGMRRDYADIQYELDQSIPVLLRMASFSAQQELEADYMGCIFAAQAGFDPNGMLSLLRKLSPDNGSSVFATHPSSEQRIRQAQTILPIGRALSKRYR